MSWPRWYQCRNAANVREDGVADQSINQINQFLDALAGRIIHWRGRDQSNRDIPQRQVRDELLLRLSRFG